MKTVRINKPTHGTYCSSNLEIGDMMEVGTDDFKSIILKTYACLVCLNNPGNTWPNSVTLRGRKLNPGEGITLIQE